MALASAEARKTSIRTDHLEQSLLLTISGSHLGRLVGTAVERETADLEVVHLLSRSRGRLERGEDWARGDWWLARDAIHKPSKARTSVDTDVLGSKLEGEGTGEGNDSTLGGRVVDHSLGSLPRSDRGGVDDGGTSLQVGHGEP